MAKAYSAQEISKETKEVASMDEFDFGPPVEIDYTSANSKSSAVDIVKSDADEDEDEFDDFSDLGIDINEIAIDEAKKKVKKEVIEVPALPAKKEVNVKFLDLSCAEFTGRLQREAFPLCQIDVQKIKYSKIELVLSQEGRIASYENTSNLSEDKKLCLSGYVANRPAMNVGTEFTCRVLIQ